MARSANEGQSVQHVSEFQVSVGQHVFRVIGAICGVGFEDRTRASDPKLRTWHVRHPRRALQMPRDNRR